MTCCGTQRLFHPVGFGKLIFPLKFRGPAIGERRLRSRFELKNGDEFSDGEIKRRWVVSDGGT